MKTLWIACLFVVTGTAFACTDPAGSETAVSDSSSASCVLLLAGIDAMEPKVDWAACTQVPIESVDAGSAREPGVPPPPPPLIELDRVHCALLDPNRAELDTCLMEVLATSTSTRDDPRCPRLAESMPLADLAFFVLVDRHPDLWTEVLPKSVVDLPAVDLADWLAEPGQRARLAERVRGALEQP